MFHLLRHASHGHVGTVLTGRLSGAPLTPAGREEALALGRYLAGRKPDAIYTSPRLRAQQTAEIVGRETNTPYEVAPELDEIDFGDWSGKGFEELGEDRAWRRWNEERDTAATPAGDTMERASARMTGFMHRLHADFPGQGFALVSHSDVIKAALCRTLGTPFRSVHEFEIAPASVTTLSFDSDGARLVTRNLQPARLNVGAFA
ncbi:histidine phosphatase family protein [Chelativorans sp. AA-79]|uniref:histidine phosphatase family protein n=1 Tax=Chelativorans sp. AA-79 TaxID=3028735 RepID=UPI0023F76A04|nr:histidine phosphatase family protein [Chelativorans sp. AA-79]WEX10412.1 histidine phosphatase family protein [Chelativorans sp. AA-79]